MSKLTPLGQLLHANSRSYLLDDLLVKTVRRAKDEPAITPLPGVPR